MIVGGVVSVFHRPLHSTLRGGPVAVVTCDVVAAVPPVTTRRSWFAPAMPTSTAFVAKSFLRADVVGLVIDLLSLALGVNLER